MSKQNTLDVKASRRYNRAAHRTWGAEPMPFFGVAVNRHDVTGHRYLAVKGFPYSQSVANVPLKGDSHEEAALPG